MLGLDTETILKLAQTFFVCAVGIISPNSTLQHPTHAGDREYLVKGPRSLRYVRTAKCGTES